MAGAGTGGARGRPPSPMALQIVKGRKDGVDAAGRPLKIPPKFKRVAPEKPADLAGPGAALWDRVIETFDSIQSLKAVDGAALLLACDSLNRWHDARQLRAANGMTTVTSQGIGVAPWVRIEQQAAAEFRGWCQEFGLTPSAEMRLAKAADGESDDDNPFAD